MAIDQARVVVKSVYAAGNIPVDIHRAYEESTLQALRQCDVVLDGLRAKSRRLGYYDRNVYLKSLSELQEQRAGVLARLQGLRGARDTWDSMKCDVDRALIDLQQAIKKAQTLAK